MILRVVKSCLPCLSLHAAMKSCSGSALCFLLRPCEAWVYEFMVYVLFVLTALLRALSCQVVRLGKGRVINILPP